MKKCTNLIFAVSAFFYIFTSLLYADEAAVDKFQISINSVDAPYAKISAEMNVKAGRLITGTGGSYDWQRGWADFISDLSAKTAEGEILEITESGESFDSYWLLTSGGTPYSGAISVRYKVDLIYARTEWDFGNEQAGRIYKGGLYSVTKPIFVSTGNNSGAEVYFDLPDGWDIAAPWKALPGQDNAFIAEDWLALHNNAITVGEFERARLSLSGFDLEIILLGDFPGAPPLVAETVEQVLPVYLDLFPDTPTAKYMMYYLKGASEDAEAFKNGAAFTTSLTLSADNKIFWADFLAHELFHFWNGVRIRAAERWQGNWFSEGFTDYYANLVLVNRGVLSESWFMRRMENIFGNYLYFHFSGLFEGLSVLEAGKEKGRNRFGIYDAGWVLAFALDDEIRTRTNGEKSLDDAMKALYARYGKTGERYQLDDLLAVISSSTGLDLAAFFDIYLKSRTALPLQDIMKSFGWTSYSNTYANEFYLTEDKAVGEREKARWKYLIHQRFSGIK